MSETACEFLPITAKSRTPHLVTQEEFNDLVRDTKISQRASEIWASRLQQWNLTAPGFKVTSARKRDHTAKFDECFAVHEAFLSR